ncbi:MAG: GNAT family N-acetyltransferase [Planctomycetia bacterium]|nr:GNAT family N-acetyltransferase [Planctomycetia bacterium]
MKISYFKRFKMEIDLADLPPVPALPAGFSFVGWDESLLELHAEVKFCCFQDEIDGTVFPNLSTRAGCSRLMTAIRRKPGFLADATWLLACPDGYCGTVQGVHDRTLRMGAIQNLGITPAYRGHGLGTILLRQALEGFRLHGLGRAYLEVTAQNDAAIHLYRRLGFRCRKTVYKAVECAGAAPSI